MRHEVRANNRDDENDAISRHRINLCNCCCFCTFARRCAFRSSPADWRAGIGASPSVLALATAWLFIFHNTPLGKSPMGVRAQPTMLLRLQRSFLVLGLALVGVTLIFCAVFACMCFPALAPASTSYPSSVWLV